MRNSMKGSSRVRTTVISRSQFSSRTGCAFRANYDWTFGHERVVVPCREHLEILDHLEREAAAAAAASRCGGEIRHPGCRPRGLVHRKEVMNKPHRTSGESLLSLQYRPNRKCVEL